MFRTIQNKIIKGLKCYCTHLQNFKNIVCLFQRFYTSYYNMNVMLTYIELLKKLKKKIFFIQKYFFTIGKFFFENDFHFFFQNWLYFRHDCMSQRINEFFSIPWEKNYFRNIFMFNRNGIVLLWREMKWLNF